MHPVPRIHKFGGSSLADTDAVKRVARKIVAERDGKEPTVVVASAMGKTTSRLLDKALDISDLPPRRELDMLLSSGERVSCALLAMALKEIGVDAIPLSGPQSGIITDDNHSAARIVEVDPTRVREELARDRVVIVTGFQGATREGEVTTLGRGGSDTTAVALAAALSGGHCTIHSDIDGVYTGDPNAVESPLHLEHLSCASMAEYSRRGAGVLHRNCLEFSEQHDVEIRAHATFGGPRHTRIAPDGVIRYSDHEEGLAGCFVGVASHGDNLRLRLAASDPGRRAALEERLDGFERLTRAISDRENTPLDWIIHMDDLEESAALADDLREEFGSVLSVTPGLTTATVVADDADSVQRAARLAVDALQRADVPTFGSFRRERSHTWLVPPKQEDDALRAMHAGLFELKPGMVGA